MKNNKFPLPKVYWIYLSITIISAIFLYTNIDRTDGWTGNKEFSEFVSTDWLLFIVFLLEEIILGTFMFVFAIKVGKLARKRNEERQKYYDNKKYDGITPGDYDYVWFDFSSEERALIMKNGDTFVLQVDVFDFKTETWNALNSASIFNSLEDVKKTLYYDYDFYCTENAELDQRGDEVYKGNQ